MRRDNKARRRSIVQDAFGLTSSELGTRVARGAGYQFVGIALKTATTLGSVAVLARLLTPADFGQIAMATVVTELASLLGNFGFSNVLIQKQRITRLQLDTVFWASFALGAILGFLVFFGSFFAEQLFPGQSVAPYLRVLSLTFVINGLGAVPFVILTRLLYFKIQFRIQIVSKITGAFSAIAAAYAGYGAWSLVIGALASTSLEVGLGIETTRYLPRFKAQWLHLSTTWRTSGSYFLGGLLYYANMNLDLALIGRNLGSAPLGYYQNARALTDEIRARIAVPIQNVLFPAFSIIQGEDDRLRKVVMSSGRLLAAVVVPIGFGVAAIAPELVLTLYGANWSQMVSVMSVFGYTAAIRAATAIASPIFNAADRVELALRYNVVGTLVTVGAILLTVDRGINAVAVAVALSSLYALVPFRASLGLIGMRTAHMLRLLGPSLIAAGLMVAAIDILRNYMQGMECAVFIRLLSEVVVGALVYVILLLAISASYLREFKKAAAHLVGRA